ncbi:hypothetical protein CA54_25790 [Symmachiella macrocystis]|uniref:Uncharacterized protein n=1 Tax=Symmachiella macrocystis TaxID=2527985 RepID=A0A5C6BSQ7_9PLAN|nr:hypothetical protein [Symmachiella macrocystis]TWU13744.1 hypothetical protein CA54_25790 [Symmachiella macrocystis]
MKYLYPARLVLFLCFLLSMPLTMINGHGRGGLADPGHWQGYDITFFWSSLIVMAPVHFGPFFMASTMMFFTPFLIVPELNTFCKLIISVWSIGALFAIPIVCLWGAHDGMFPAVLLWIIPVFGIGTMNLYQCIPHSAWVNWLSEGLRS